MDKSRVAIATMTWVRTAEDEVRLQRAMSALSQLGFPVTVADRGTSPSFAERMSRLANVHIVESREPSLVKQIQSSVRTVETSAHDYVLYTEPDKILFFESALERFVQAALHRRGVGLVLAARSQNSFDTYPPRQRLTEGVINQLCGDIFGQPGDYLYGPFLMSVELVEHVRSLDTSLGWGWRTATFRHAYRQGVGIDHVVGDFPCPVDQGDEDESERTHRLRQLIDNARGLVDAAA